MARLVMKNGHPKRCKCYDGLGPMCSNIESILRLIVDAYYGESLTL